MICEFCKRDVEILTKHSLTGGHKSPFIKVCRICHDKIHGTRPIKNNQRKKLKLFLLDKLKNTAYENLIDLPINSNKGLR